MLSRKDATSIAEVALVQAGADMPSSPEIIITQIDERDLTWVFFYQSKQFIDTGDFMYSLVGNGPLLVHKRTKRFAITATFPPISERIAEAELWLDSLGNEGARSVTWYGLK
jgi:hypothetical protein